MVDTGHRDTALVVSTLRFCNEIETWPAYRAAARFVSFSARLAQAARTLRESRTCIRTNVFSAAIRWRWPVLP